MPYFSIVIPLYNKENFVAATINSVLAQTFTDFEVIIINDVSTDNSLAVAQRFDDSRIRIISHPVNKGLSASRNTGIKNASSEYIAFLDADDLWKPEFLETIRQLIVDYPEAGLFATKYEQVYPENVIVPSFKLQLTNNRGVVDFYKSNLNEAIYYPSCLCVRKIAFEKAGLYDERINFGEDIDFNIRAHQFFKLAYCDEPQVSYTMDSQNQITRSGISNKTLTNFDRYEIVAKNRKDIKRYLDFNRYFMAKEYRKEGNEAGYRKMVKGIDPKSLNYKQRLLLLMPGALLRMVSKIKGLLLKKGIVVNSYD
ncbi:glycosyltransferase family 2 protein [Flavobacterium sp. MFBS3-15]|uniref:glycosyltransferase family 2 protein n=1 Tax=Flavobacterium sp. MFBS3-15 TaxID=2989816 RepID=UPI0022354D6B|nr:glycosyltransferase family A protein [Flavobacterium sp. MFBS3-15]MCW4468409.1 glycosyltransferase family 2 protein [Flavobacterium sp. MFBS3-15]